MVHWLPAAKMVSVCGGYYRTGIRLCKNKLALPDYAPAVQKSLRKAREVWFLNNEDARVFIDEKIVNIEKVKVLPGEGINTSFLPRFKTSRSTGRTFTFLMSTRLVEKQRHWPVC